jgi:cell wall-associated NlpC family hydrolase
MRLLTAIGAAVVLLVLACGGLFGALAGGAATASCTGLPAATVSLPAGGLTPPAGGYPPVGTWNREAVGNAAIIVGVGARMGVPVRGWIIAVATAIQESSLINLPDLGDENNADSLGLFQQRPSQGWGTPAQIMDPAYASTKFYEHLLAVPGWQSIPLTEAAQAVQRSATTGAYAQWEPDATRIVAAITGSANAADPSALAAACDPSNLQAVPSGFTLPPDTPPAVTAAILWAFAQLGTPYSFGGDCTNAHGGDPAHQCDCSSLMQQAYKAGGITLPRTSQEQFHAGTPVPDISGLRPGDLVFVPGAKPGTKDAPGHVGMYIGSGLVVAAPQTGDVVHITNLSPYWTNNLAGIRRVA